MATYRAIPVPKTDETSLLSCVQALKEVVEQIIGIRGSVGSLISSDTSSSATSSGFTQAQILARISLGV